MASDLADRRGVFFHSRPPRARAKPRGRSAVLRYTVGPERIPPASRETTKNTRNRTNSTHAISEPTAATGYSPKKPAIKATSRKNSAKRSMDHSSSEVRVDEKAIARVCRHRFCSDDGKGGIAPIQVEAVSGSGPAPYGNPQSRTAPAARAHCASDPPGGRS